MQIVLFIFFFFSSRRRHTRSLRDWSSDVCSSDLDQLETGDSTAQELGVYPALSRLETLLYPSSAIVIANEALTLLGVIEVIPAEAPLTLLVWGLKRVVPVRLTSFTITEEAFDPNLNPIRAKVSLELAVLSYDDLGLLSVGGALFMAHQIAKEAFAKQSTTPLAATGIDIGI